MQFNSHANNDDIVSDIKWWLTGSYNGSIDYHINDITRNVNRRFDETAMLIFRSDGRWQWDDSNNTTAPTGWTEYSGDAPIVVDDLDASTLQYTAATADFLQILEVAVKKTDGTWHVLTSLDRNKGNAQFYADQESTSGLPEHYDKIGQYLRLDKLPSSSHVTLTAGLRITFQRNPSYFAVSDTTKTPGFATPFHRILSVGAAIDFCIANGWGKKQVALEKELQKLHEGLIAHYSARSKDEQVRLGLQSEDFGGDSTHRTLSENRFNV